MLAMQQLKSAIIGVVGAPDRSTILKIFCFVQWLSKVCSYQNILRKIFRNLSSQQHQNILSEKFLVFLTKLVGPKFSDFWQKFLRTQIFVDRTKPT